jgi:hypothetical protein
MTTSREKGRFRKRNPEAFVRTTTAKTIQAKLTLNHPSKSVQQEDPVSFALGFVLTHRKAAPSELGAPIAAAPMIGSNRGLRSSALANPFSSSQTPAAAVRSVILLPTGLFR